MTEMPEVDLVDLRLESACFGCIRHMRGALGDRIERARARSSDEPDQSNGYAARHQISLLTNSSLQILLFIVSHPHFATTLFLMWPI